MTPVGFSATWTVFVTCVGKEYEDLELYYSSPGQGIIGRIRVISERGDYVHIV